MIKSVSLLTMFAQRCIRQGTPLYMLRPRSMMLMAFFSFCNATMASAFKLKMIEVENSSIVDFLKKDVDLKDQRIQEFAATLCAEVAKKEGIGSELKLNAVQGWNGIAFRDKSKDYLVKFARGGQEIKEFEDIEKVLARVPYNKDFGVSLPLPLAIYEIVVSGKKLDQFTVQTSRFFKNDSQLETVVKRNLEGKWWVSDNGDKWYDKAFNAQADMRLMRMLGKSVGRFQRGGKTFDGKGEPRTLVHGDLYQDHVLIQGYRLDNWEWTEQEVKSFVAKFALVDLVTLNYVDDKSGVNLLVDPIYLSSIFLWEGWRPNFRQGMFDLFNSFYEGYVQEFSNATLNQLSKLYESDDSAVHAYAKASVYLKTVGKVMKTQEPKIGNVNVSNSQRETLEREFASFHRLAFLHAYYKVQKKANDLMEIQKLQSQWRLTLAGSMSK